jgi:hypothetical protein
MDGKTKNIAASVQQTFRFFGLHQALGAHRQLIFFISKSRFGYLNNGLQGVTRKI